MKQVITFLSAILAAFTLIASCGPKDENPAQPASGSLVESFGTGGVILGVATPPFEKSFARSILVSGSSLYVSVMELSGFYQSRWKIEKRSAVSGALDAGFFHDGFFTTDMSADGDVPYAMVSDGAGLYLCGYYDVGADVYWHLEKHSLADGHVDLFFKWDNSATPVPGWVNENPSPEDDCPNAMTIDSGSLYIAGFDDSPGGTDWEWRIEKRSAETGAPVAAFGGAGFVVSNPSPKIDSANSIAFDHGDLYIGGDDGGGAFGRARIEKRRADTGALVAGFDGDGVLNLDWSADDDGIVWLTAKDNMIYVVGYDGTNAGADTEWRIEKRRESDGEAIWSVASLPAPGRNQPQSAAIDGDYLYIVGYQDGSVNVLWRVEKRRTSDGSLVEDFGEGGVVNSSAPDLGYHASAIAVDSDSIYVAGVDYSLGSDHARYMIEKRRK